MLEGQKAVDVETEDHKKKNDEAGPCSEGGDFMGRSDKLASSILMLSDIGNADHLKEVGVSVIQHLPAVGQNMEDHLHLYIQFMCKKSITLHNANW